MTDHLLTALLDDPDEAVRRRALLVRDALSLGSTRAARRHGVTRQTAAKWVDRYRAGGADRLRGEAHRRRTLEQVRRAVLTAPLWMPTTKWSSRTIAAAVGVSQSHVARVWAHGSAHTAVADRLADVVGSREPAIVGLLVVPGFSALAVRLGPRASRLVAAAPAAPRTQRALRTILAADLARDEIDTADDSPARSFWDDLAATCPDPASLVVVTSAPAPVPVAGAAHLACGDAAEWQALLGRLSGWRDDAVAAAAAALEADLREWHREGGRVFSWVAPSPARARRPRPPVPRSSARRTTPERTLADEIVATVREGVATGRFAGGDRVTERFLAGRLHTTRGQIRAALRLLEGDGLVTISHGRGAVVPIPTVTDVVETYAARRALGALMVGAATRCTPAALRPVADVLAEVERLAAVGDNAGCNQADMAFQHALADASGLTRIGPMLQLMGLQVQMFIAVIGITYAFPTERVVARNRAILAAIGAEDDELAVQIWREKIDEALAYMLEQVGSLSASTRRRPR